MDTPSRRVFARWPSFALLFLAAVYLTLRWDSIPPRWIIHWGPGGEPNGWATRTIPGVFGLLGLGAAILVVTETLAAVRRRADGVASEEPMRAATSHFVRVVMFGVTAMVAMLAVDLPLGPRMPVGALVLMGLAPVAISLVAGGLRLAAALREMRDRGHGAKVEGYHALYYANTRDQRLWVPKLGGMGWTINFSHPLAWPVLLLILAVPIAAVIVSAIAL